MTQYLQRFLVDFPGVCGIMSKIENIIVVPVAGLLV